MVFIGEEPHPTFYHLLLTASTPSNIVEGFRTFFLSFALPDYDAGYSPIRYPDVTQSGTGWSVGYRLNSHEDGADVGGGWEVVEADGYRLAKGTYVLPYRMNDDRSVVGCRGGIIRKRGMSLIFSGGGSLSILALFLVEEAKRFEM